MAECHPVAFQWVMEAKARGATVIHVDPRFTRTSAVSDLYLPIRAGADIAFVGGLINYVLSSGKYFKEYMLAYTNAATILTEDYADTEDLDGVFSGLNQEHRYYDFDTWRYQGQEEVKPASGEHQDPDAQQRTRRQLRQLRQAGRGKAHGSGGAAAHPTPDTDDTLQHPRYGPGARPCVTSCGNTSSGPVSPAVPGRTCDMDIPPASGLDPAARAGYSDHPPRMGFFTDTSVCIGCKACEVACKEWNAVPEDGLLLTCMSYDNIGACPPRRGGTWRSSRSLPPTGP